MAITVLDGNGDAVSLETPNANGRAAASASKPVALSTEDKAALDAVTTALGGDLSVTGTFWQATQPVSLADPVAVTGTFYQATQPVSAASLPLPTGAATDATVASGVPATSWATITPGSSTLSPVPKAIWVNQACDITLEDGDATSVVFTVAAAGPLPVRPTKITAISTGTVVGFYD